GGSPGSRLRHLVPVAGGGDAPPRGASYAQDHAGNRPRRRGRHALGRYAGLVLRTRSCGGRCRARGRTRGRGSPLPARLRRSPALPRPRGRFVPSQAPFLDVSDRGFRRAAARRRRLPRTPLRRALPDRQLARDAVGPRHDPARPHFDEFTRWSLPERRADTAVADNPVLVGPALPADTLHDPAPLGRDEPAATDIRAGGMRPAPPVHGPAHRAGLVGKQTAWPGAGGIGAREGAGPPALRAARYGKAERARHLADAARRHRHRAPRRPREGTGDVREGPGSGEGGRVPGLTPLRRALCPTRREPAGGRRLPPPTPREVRGV